MVQRLFGASAEVDVQLVPVDPARTDHQLAADRSWLDATRDDATRGQVSIKCAVVVSNSQQQLQTTVRVVDNPILDHQVRCCRNVGTGAHAIEHLKLLLRCWVVMCPQIAVLGATAQAFQQRIATCAPTSPHHAFAKAIQAGLATLLNDTLVKDTPYHEAAKRFVAQLKRTIPLRRFDVQFGDDIVRVGHDSASHLAPPAAAVANAHGQARVYPVTSWSSTGGSDKNDDDHDDHHYDHHDASCAIVAEDEHWDYVKEVCVQQCRTMLQVVHAAAAHCHIMRDQHAVACDHQMFQQTKLEQHVLQQEESIEAAVRILDVLRRCVDTYCKKAQLAPAGLVELPELASALGAASCVLHRSDICDDDENASQQSTKHNNTPDAGDAGCSWRIALAEGGGDEDDSNRDSNHRRLPVLSVKGGQRAVLDSRLFRMGLVQIAKLCLYCRECKSVIARLSEVLREHSNLKGLALKVCLALRLLRVALVSPSRSYV
jgi:hypothetical protein